MKNEKEYTGRIRSLRILFAIVESPFRYTKKQLADKYNVSESAIKDDFEAFKSAGFELTYDERYRYALALDRKFDSLKSLLVFTPKDEEIMMRGIESSAANPDDITKLKHKLSRIYDASKMPNTFDKNFLTKMDLLEKARIDKKIVLLKDYHSTNSNTVADRKVEVFHVSGEDDIIHAFDLESKKLKHFRISRISKLEITTTVWAHEGHHIIVATDPFRIHNNEQVFVHLRLKVGGYNELIERFPVTRAYIKPSPEGDNLYDLECKVNNKFLGITNFILGYCDDVIAILEPESLVEHIREVAKKLIVKKF